MTALEGADGFKTPAGNSGRGVELKWQAVSDHPGSQTVSSLTRRLCGNQGDPGIGAKYRAPSDKPKQRGRGRGAGESVARGPEVPIVAMNAGNSAGAKGCRFEIVNRGYMPRHRADYAHDNTTYSLHTMGNRSPSATL